MSLLVSGASERELQQLTSVFRLLADKTRLNVLLLLASGERNVTSLCEELRLPQPTVSHHLGLLRMSSIIGNRRDGKQIFYTLHGRVNIDSGALRISVDRFSITIETARDGAGGTTISADDISALEAIESSRDTDHP